MYDPLLGCEPDAKTVSVFGSDFVLDENSDIKRLLKRYDYKVLELPGCKTWQELLPEYFSNASSISAMPSSVLS